MKIEKVFLDNETLYVKLNSGHIIGNPIVWFERLNSATPEQRNDFEIGVTKQSIHWEKLNEDISLESLFDFKRELNHAKI